MWYLYEFENDKRPTSDGVWFWDSRITSIDTHRMSPHSFSVVVDTELLYIRESEGMLQVFIHESLLNK